MSRNGCWNCKHIDKSEDEAPCMQCTKWKGYDKWEPKKDCSNCKHYEKGLSEMPCEECDIEHKNWEPQEVIKFKKRPEMLPEPLPIYEHTFSKIPERVRISFDNGTSAVYDLHTEQPAPIIMENITIIRRMTGYEAPKPRRRNRK